MNVINGLKRLRIKAGYNKTGMAHSAGMKPRTWSDWEQDPPDALQWLVNLAQHHEVSVDYILGLTNDPRPAPNDSLPEGAQQIIEYMADMSPRGRAELLLVCKSIREIDRSWQNLEMAARVGRAMLGEDEFAQLNAELTRLISRVGRDAALDVIEKRVVANFASDHQRENPD